MALKPGDFIDEFKRYPDSCGLVVKVLGGGSGFQKIICCGHELTEEDVVPAPVKPFGRKLGAKGLGFILDEKKSHPNACGLRLIIVGGGQGLQQVDCCGHTLNVANEKQLLDLDFGKVRKADEEEDEAETPGGPSGTA